MISASNAAVLLNQRMGAGAAAAVSSPGMSVAPAVKGMSNEQMDKVSSDFESMFVSQMLEQMFGDSLGDDAFGDKETSEIYKSMMVDQYGKQIANAGGIGIAAYVKQELLKLQEIKHG